MNNEMVNAIIGRELPNGKVLYLFDNSHTYAELVQFFDNMDSGAVVGDTSDIAKDSNSFFDLLLPGNRMFLCMYTGHLTSKPVWVEYDRLTGALMPIRKIEPMLYQSDDTLYPDVMAREIRDKTLMCMRKNNGAVFSMGLKVVVGILLIGLLTLIFVL